MFKLINLELEKRKGNMIRTLTWNWLLVIAICVGLITTMLYIDQIFKIFQASSAEIANIQKDMPNLDDLGGIKVLVDTLIGTSFLVYGGINCARFVVQDFSSRHLEQLFVYPVSRTKIMYAKVVLAAMVTGFGMVLGKFVMYAYMHLLGFQIDINFISIVEVFTTSFSVALISQIAMAVGIWKKSVIATVVAASILASITQGNIGVIQLQQFPIITYVTALIALFISIRFIQNIKRKDFFN